MEQHAECQARLDQLPDAIWNNCDFTSIHAAILFADLENSVLISGAIQDRDYDDLVNAFQTAMKQLVDTLREQDFPVGESSIAGDQLTLFFYEPGEVASNYLLDGPAPLSGEARAAEIAKCVACNQNLAFCALKAAITLKNLWLVQPFNMQRITSRREPFTLGIGIHTGRVYLRNRPDGQRRIEGYTVNLAKRVESFSRQGRYSHIMLSQPACDTIRGSMRKHTQLKQRIFFHQHESIQEHLKGILTQQQLYELKSYHRIGIHPPPEAIEPYEIIFTVDPTSLWAYYQLADHYAYDLGDWDRAFALAKRAYLIHPKDEKVLYDLAKYYYQRGNLEQAREHCLQALAQNPEFDLIYEQLGLIANQQEAPEECIGYWRKAVALSPGSAINHANLGMALKEYGALAQAAYHISEALRIYPEYLQSPIMQDAVRCLAEAGHPVDSAPGSDLPACAS